MSWWYLLVQFVVPYSLKQCRSEHSASLSHLNHVQIMWWLFELLIKCSLFSGCKIITYELTFHYKRVTINWSFFLISIHTNKCSENMVPLQSLVTMVTHKGFKMKSKAEVNRTKMNPINIPDVISFVMLHWCSYRIYIGLKRKRLWCCCSILVPASFVKRRKWKYVTKPREHLRWERCTWKPLISQCCTNIHDLTHMTLNRDEQELNVDGGMNGNLKNWTESCSVNVCLL